VREGSAASRKRKSREGIAWTGGFTTPRMGMVTSGCTATPVASRIEPSIMPTGASRRARMSIAMPRAPARSTGRIAATSTVAGLTERTFTAPGSSAGTAGSRPSGSGVGRISTLAVGATGALRRNVRKTSPSSGRKRQHETTSPSIRSRESPGAPSWAVGSFERKLTAFT
jgi:hypothetical protein